MYEARCPRRSLRRGRRWGAGGGKATPPVRRTALTAMAEPAAYTLAPGQAPVKREYIRTFAAVAPAAAPVDDDEAEAGGANEPAQAGAEQPRKRQCAPRSHAACSCARRPIPSVRHLPLRGRRGMNKNRTHHRPVQAVRMCNTFVKTSHCQVLMIEAYA